MKILGIDIGGSGIKGAIVDVSTGKMLSKRFRIPTPQPAKPKLMAETVREIVQHFDWNGPVGCCFPTVVNNGKCCSSGNISPDWIGIQVDEYFSKACGGLNFFVGNDADLAGIAEVQFGAGKGVMGKLIMITIGTGLGSGLFYNGHLIPNLELGFLLHGTGDRIELWASDSARKREDLKLKEWAKRFDFFLNYVERVMLPDHIILGGGLSKKFDKFKSHLSLDIPVDVARFRNKAGIIGAAVFAKRILLNENELSVAQEI